MSKIFPSLLLEFIVVVRIKIHSDMRAIIMQSKAIGLNKVS